MTEDVSPSGEMDSIKVNLQLGRSCISEETSMDIFVMFPDPSHQKETPTTSRDLTEENAKRDEPTGQHPSIPEQTEALKLLQYGSVSSQFQWKRRHRQPSISSQQTEDLSEEDF